MRIAIICHPHHPIREPWAGGMEMHTAMIARALRDRGHAVQVLAKEGSELPSGVDMRPVESAGRTYLLNPDPERAALQDRWTAEAITRACRQVQADAGGSGAAEVVLNNSLSALPHRLLRGHRVLTMMHSPVPVPSFMEMFAQSADLPPGHRFATVSEANARAWREHCRRVDVLPNGVDTAFWGDVPTSSAPPGGEPGERLTALWTGRMTRQKGLHVALEAARLAHADLRISGPPSDPAYIQREIAPHVDGRRVRLLGHRSHREIRAELAAADVFIASPLWAEPFGLAPVEAMATGTPVAATPRGAMPEVIGEGGALAATTDPEDLAEAILRARRIDPAAARRRASRYGLDRMAQGYERLLGAAA